MTVQTDTSPPDEPRPTPAPEEDPASPAGPGPHAEENSVPASGAETLATGPGAPASGTAPRSRRRRVLRIVKRTAVALTALVLLATGSLAGYAYWTVHRSLPQLSGSTGVPGLDGEARIVRDASGIPQIYAATSHDLFMAEGYAQAQDRFWQMDTQRHVTSGRLSEMFGPSQVQTDKVARTFGWYRVAEQEVTLLSPETQRYLRAFSDGVNAYLAHHQGAELSVEYPVLGFVSGDYRPEPWTPADSVSWLKTMAWNLNTGMIDQFQHSMLAARLPAGTADALSPGYDYQRWAPIVPDRAPANAPEAQTLPQAPAPPAPAAQAAPGEPAPVVPAAASAALADSAGVRTVLAAVLGPQGTGIGSNSWVVSGSRTTTGKPLLENDPHLTPSLPGIWYQVGLHCTRTGPECPYDVTGFTFAGMPGVVIGHNADISWGFTDLGAADSDLFVEKVSGSGYAYKNEQLPLTVRKETIKVAGGRPVELTVRSTQHGPLISDVLKSADEVADDGKEPDVPPHGARDGYAVAMRWTALDPAPTMNALFALDRAKDWNDFRAAAAAFASPVQNMIYADRAGNIGYQTPGRIPVRKAGDGRRPVPGWTGAYDWTGYLPFDQLPTSFNPPEGYIVTANNAVVGPDYPHLIGSDWGTGYRSTRIIDLIKAAGKLDVAAMERITQDTWNGNAATLAPQLLRVAVGKDAAPAQNLLRGWDFTQGADSAPAAYFNAVWAELLKEAFTDRLTKAGVKSYAYPDGGGRWFDVVRALLDEPDSPWWTSATDPSVHGRDAMLRQAMEKASADLRKRLGDDPAKWRWGALHTLTLQNATLGTGGPAPLQWLLNADPIGVGGGTDTVMANGWDPQKGFDVIWVPSMRMVVDMADFERSRWINLTGASGHATADTYTDQTGLWADGGSLPWPYGTAAVDRAARDRLRLTP
ncbi:penicillin acylase family protein [Streptomyces sp. NBC_00083]|uniref:penicillin acylase family protein n=1 Tax=Streptomyces sp. NBC_00083 TaxID=2975647 RepID=UPI00224E4587|nr:penicillin acylase family protein [Streptomyces sp. NBC_00083]MCX5387058.1 penicillin acylase family protein [Streptomyces sp. NBC_00083]